MPNKSQPTISKFFTAFKKSAKTTYNTDDDEDSKQKSPPKVAKAVVSATVKRGSSNGSSSSHLSKKAKLTSYSNEEPTACEDGEAAEGGGPGKRSVSAWTKSRLQAFSHDSSEETMEVEVITKPQQVNGATTKSSLNNFRLKSDCKEESVTSGSCVSSSRQKEGMLKPGPLRGLPGVKLTPLEQQVVTIKNKQPEVILFVECGYKYRFFGPDAEIAGKELNIVAHLDHSFMTASIPTHRLYVHVRRLVAKGYKVGVVKQKETAALKAAGANKNTPFVRELTALYTRSTLIGEDVTPGTGGGEALGEGDLTEGVTATLLVVHEGRSTSGRDGTVAISFVAVQPSTGDLVYDSFDDSAARTELCCRLDHIQPVEAVVISTASVLTLQTISSSTTKGDDRIRMEKMDEEKFDYSLSLKKLCHLFEENEEKVKHVSGLPGAVVSCLGATLQYLKEFNLERIIKMAGCIQQYSSSNHHMRLSGATLRNLEVLSNADNGSKKGSLFWALDNTQTMFGARLLRQWIVQPLLDVEQISERHDMVEELMTSDAPILTRLKTLLLKLPDFERALTTIFHKKCSPQEFWVAVSGLSRVHQELSRVGGNIAETVRTPGLVTLLQSTIDGLSNVGAFADNINEASVKEGKKTTLLHDFSEFPEVIQRQEEICGIEEKLKNLEPEIAKTIRLPSFKYITVSGLEYLIEVKNSMLKYVPKEWSKISATKAVCRFRSPEVEKLFQKLQQLREMLQADCHQAWLQVLDSFSQHYHRHRQAVRCLATLDALVSLACVAQAQGYCRPQLIDAKEGQGTLRIVQGRHPVVSQLKLGTDQYVPNDTHMQVAGQRVMLVTGPNMGGKSCYMRQVALMALMAQIGSFVPAEEMEMSVLDAIYTRMGATDEIFSGRSTFMVEVEETANIMQEATSHSLVILDELGRGTSTHDGVAVAMSALDYFLHKVKCLTIFVTHYLPLTEFGQLYPEHVGNFHMAFIVDESNDNDGVDAVTFLYQLTSGSAGQSYGLNVARLAQVPHSILAKAAERSSFLQNTCKKKREERELFQKLIKSEDARDLLSDLKCKEMREVS